MFRTRCLIAAVLFVAAGMAQSQPGGSVRDWLEVLPGQIGRIAQTTGNWAEQRQVEEGIASRIRERAQAEPEHPSLVDKTPGGSTVLMQASLNGYALVVEALLTSPAVRRELEATNPTGATAWALANFAFKQAAWVCAPNLLSHEDPFSSAKYIVGSHYYVNAPEGQYDRIRKALANAGAKQDLQAAKNAWLANCPPAKPETIAKVKATKDLLQTLLAESAAAMTSFEASARGGAPAARR
jgi:hypothetical protein